MAEFGTGCGVGTAWLRSGVRGEQARIVTAELDAKLAEAAAEIFRDDDQVEVLAADWSTLLDRGPFSLLFLDSGEPTEVTVDSIADLVEDGGIVVLDDFTPCEIWPPITYGRVDTLREHWLTDDRFTAVEVMVAPDASTHHRHQALSRPAESESLRTYPDSALSTRRRVRRLLRVSNAGLGATSTIQAGSISWVSGPMASA